MLDWKIKVLSMIDERCVVHRPTSGIVKGRRCRKLGNCTGRDELNSKHSMTFHQVAS